jgi:hypothetical protein
MATHISNMQLALAQMGRHVVKEDAVCTADDDLFTVYGACRINLMYAITTGVGDGGASTIAINEKTDSIAIAAATTVTSDAVGTIYYVSGQADNLLNGSLAPTIKVAGLLGTVTSGSTGAGAPCPMIWNGGTDGITIEMTETGDDATLTMDWHIWYTPLEPGAYIEAAA